MSRNSLTAWLFLRRLKRKYGFKPIYTNGGSWYPLAYKWARLKHHHLDKSSLKALSPEALRFIALLQKTL